MQTTKQEKNHEIKCTTILIIIIISTIDNKFSSKYIILIKIGKMKWDYLSTPPNMVRDVWLWEVLSSSFHNYVIAQSMQKIRSLF